MNESIAHESRGCQKVRKAPANVDACHANVGASLRTRQRTEHGLESEAERLHVGCVAWAHRADCRGKIHRRERSQSEPAASRKYLLRAAVRSKGNPSLSFKKALLAARVACSDSSRSEIRATCTRRASSLAIR